MLKIKKFFMKDLRFNYLEILTAFPTPQDDTKTLFHITSTPQDDRHSLPVMLRSVSDVGIPSSYHLEQK